MKVVQLNCTCGKGSTGKICLAISNMLNENNVENYVLYTEGESNYTKAINYSSKKYKKFQAFKSRIFGNFGFNSKKATKKLIKILDNINPDIVHIHNIHGHDCNLSLLFKYLKSNNKKIIWTFHDCWAFTGYCPYFLLVKCDKWQKQCVSCPQRKKYSLLFDRSKKLYKNKKELFSELDMTIITPSNWLASLVKQSFLKDYPVKVIHNGIDLDIFKPTESAFRIKFGLENKFIVLGVAFDWDRRKGLDVFIELSKSLSDDYQVVLVGTNEQIDKILPKNIISIHRTQNQQELAEIYSVADVFVNPTREENFPTVNIEALACGTPIITFNTGGSPEIIDKTCGRVVEVDNIEELLKEVISICEEKTILQINCVKRAKLFTQNNMCFNYKNLYFDLEHV